MFLAKHKHKTLEHEVKSLMCSLFKRFEESFLKIGITAELSCVIFKSFFTLLYRKS